jgi:hypothetical protein
LQTTIPVELVLAQSAVTINVFDRKTGSSLPVPWRYLITEDIANDNASTTNPKSYSPIVATGESALPSATVDLGPGRYLVTVLGGPFPAVPGELGRDCFVDDPCGYKLGGQHFTVGGGATTVRVDLVPNPLPLATLRVRVFHDNLSVNGEDDIPAEIGIPNMPVVIEDGTGEVTVDFFGNPICTQYAGTPPNNPIPGTGGQCLTGPDGFAVIENIPPLKYEVQVIPPNGSGWIQTTTIEGTHVLDAWLEEGASGFSTEVGFLTGAVWFGFVKECTFGNSGDSCSTNNTVGTGTITGRVRQLSIDTDAPGVGTLGNPVPRPYIALNNISGNDEQVYTGRGNADGTFAIPNVPPGQYQLVYWDFPQDYIIQFLTVDMGPGQNVNLGDIGIPRWFGTIRGYAYIDSGIAKNGAVITGIPSGAEGPDSAKPGFANGYRDCLPSASGPHDINQCEPGLANQDLDVRFKDGSIKYATFTDANGYYEFPEYFEWEHFLIWEVGFGRLKHVGTKGYFADEFGNPIGYPYNPENAPELGLAGLLQAQLTWAGTYQWIDAGKLPYDPGENGGISGIVYYATTRNEFDPRLAAAEDYEPGVPSVTINLYQAALDGGGQPIACAAVGPGCPYGQGELQRASDTPIDSVQTDSWYDNRPTDCTYHTPLPTSPGTALDPLCLELPRTWNQIKDGVFDGGYAFEGTPAGEYIVEMAPPPGYQQIREEDQNTDQGDDFVPQVPPPPCAGPLHLVNDPRNPAHGTMQPLCDSKIVTVVDGFNAPAEFHLMTVTQVPPPGMIRGLLVDDLILQLDPNSPLYIEKRGIPNTSVGILDFQGNEITRVYSDEDGYWEVLLPSSYTAHCPVPGGICPNMYRVVGNYPGDPRNPDPRWNPNYGSLFLVFDVWPGKTTYADVALLPTTNLLPNPTNQFITPPRCEPVADTPDVRIVSTVYGNAGDTFTIQGANFGGTAGAVTLGGAPLAINSWSATAVNVTIPAGHPAGPQQLVVTRANGNVARNGLTFHVIGAGYNPTIQTVDDDGPADYTTIQAAIDNAPAGALIVVQDGVYFETLVLHKNVKLQGHGPNSTVIDGRFFNFGGMTPAEFQAKVASLTFGGPASVPMGQVLTILAEDGEFGAAYTTQIDGFAIRGGSVVRGNVPAGATQQGGAIYAHAFARYLEISNNLLQTNNGLTGGGIILGQAYSGDRQNDNVSIHHNQVLNNGGKNLAGALALFNGAENYDIGHNFICGNYSAEYGGGISHFGLSPSGHIHDNQILFNYSFDEGGGVMIAGELPTNPNAVSVGAGPVLIERNLLQGNLSNDDGGGIRLLQPVDGPITIQNNLVVNNLATDNGGGISVDDALDVRIVNNTIAKNISTATAEDADRSTCNPPLLGSCPHGAGLTAEAHSAALRAARGLPLNSFSDPVLFNNIFWENQAYFLDGAGGLPSAGIIDLEVVGTTSPRFFTPNFSILTTPYGAGAGNMVGSDPQFVQEIDLDFVATPFAGDPAFVVVLVRSLPTDPPGDYHVVAGSPAVNAGAASQGSLAAPCDDFDGAGRPVGAAHDIGADEQPGAPGACSGGPVNTPPTVNAGLDQTITLPALANLDGAVTDDGLPGPFTTLWTQQSGPGTVTFGSATAIDTTASFSAPGVYVLRLTANDGQYQAFDELTVTVQPATGSGVVLYFSVDRNGTVGGVTDVRDDDILSFDGANFTLFFDGSDVGVPGTVNLDAFTRINATTILMSFDNPIAANTLSGLTVAVDDSDIVQFNAAQLGATTQGVFSLFFDGSVVGLTTNGEDVDALDVLPDGRLVLSTVGVARVFSQSNNPASLELTSRAEDLLTFTPNSAGAYTDHGVWAIYFDGSDVQLASGDENVDALAIAGNGDLYFSTEGDFKLTGLGGKDEDVFVCASPTTGANTVCTYPGTLFFDGSRHSGVGNKDVDAIDLP